MNVSAAKVRPAHCVVISSVAFALVLLLSCAPKALAPPVYPRAPAVASTAAVSAPAQAPEALWRKAQDVFETRCVVCHGCNDAPCQLKLDSFEGIARGGTGQKVYDSSRLTAAAPTRLFIDAHGAAAWRERGFHPVLAEAPTGDPRAGLLLRMLELKRGHPLPDAEQIEDTFSFGLDREQVCTQAQDFDRYAEQHPLWGMPYGLPAIADAEYAVLREWVDAGAPHPETTELPAGLGAAIASWEDFLNAPSLKGRLAARYIYEHLFVASLYFEGVDDQTFFRLVRSRAPIGSPVDEIATRRPFDDPGPGVFYYRFVRRSERPLEKTHMPYALNQARLERYRSLFIEPEYKLEGLPSYEPEVAANPFVAFAALPVASRYRFMLDEAEFTLMGFIKGPVCRGPVALDVIQDRFWIAFIDPDAPWLEEEAAFLATVKTDLDLPAEAGSNALPTRWFGYAREHARYVAKKNDFLRKVAEHGHGLTLASIWDGDGDNRNAALTVFRHFDSATVVQGLLGGAPKTAWVLSYPVLERIHYLLVARFDVFGNVGHQLTTRLYMDFLRMEAEYNFLVFLPKPARTRLVDFWYRGTSKAVKDRVYGELARFDRAPNIRYRSKAPEHELFSMLEARLARVRSRKHQLDSISDSALGRELEQLASVSGQAASWMPETAFVALDTADGQVLHLSVLRESAHSNVAQLFDEEDRRLTAEDGLSVLKGFVGAYPNALFELPRAELASFVHAVEQLDSHASYLALRKRFGILRASADFWQHSDRMRAAYRADEPLTSGAFDYSRLEAF